MAVKPNSWNIWACGKIKPAWASGVQLVVNRSMSFRGWGDLCPQWVSVFIWMESSDPWVFSKDLKNPIALNLKFTKMLEISGCVCDNVLFSRTMLERQWPAPCGWVNDFTMGRTNPTCRCSLAPFRLACIHDYYCPFSPNSSALASPSGQRSTREYSNHAHKYRFRPKGVMYHLNKSQKLGLWTV